MATVEDVLKRAEKLGHNTSLSPFQDKKDIEYCIELALRRDCKTKEEIIEEAINILNIVYA